MDVKLQEAALSAWSKLETDALVILSVGSEVPKGLDAALASALQSAVDDGDLQWAAGKSLLLRRPSRVRATRVVASVMADDSAKAFAKALQAALAWLKPGGARSIAIGVAGMALSAAQAEAAAVVLAEAAYLYQHTKPSAGPTPRLAHASLLVAGQAGAEALKPALARGLAMAEGITLAREWANRPGNHATPSALASQAKRLGKSHGLRVEVLDRKDCEKLGMGAFMAVARGSDEPPRFIVMHWNGAPKSQAPVVLVGKGITFDSGGISIKPAAEMDEMKFDMGGAASVLGTMAALARLKARVNVVGVIAACENLPSGRAVKPGDVVTSMAGQTIEILNTDAEGRLILCDALCYVERFKPAAVVDIATLTGACMIALGGVRSGLFTPDDTLASELLEAGDKALDPCWRMPVDVEYDEALKSNFADMANVGPRAGGAITAAMFLKRFAGKYAWAHLDVAGTAWKSGAAKGATGRPVGLLTQFVLGRVKA